MKVLLDHNLSRKLRRHLAGHEVFTAGELNIQELNNGLLLQFAEERLFDVLLTADQNIWYQQNNRSRQVSLVVVSTNRTEVLLDGIMRIRDAIASSKPASYIFLDFSGAESNGKS